MRILCIYIYTISQMPFNGFQIAFSCRHMNGEFFTRLPTFITEKFFNFKYIAVSAFWKFPVNFKFVEQSERCLTCSGSRYGVHVRSVSNQQFNHFNVN